MSQTENGSPSITSTLEDLDLEHELVQLVVRETVRAGMSTPLREPIREAVEETSGGAVAEPTEAEPAETTEDTGETLEDDRTGDTQDDEPTADDPADSTGKSGVTKAVQGLVVFAVMFVVLYAALRRLTGTENE
jgi:hypothetical protein